MRACTRTPIVRRAERVWSLAPTSRLTSSTEATRTVLSIVGAVLGAAYGVKKMPRRWVDKVEESELIKESAALFAGWLGR